LRLPDFNPCAYKVKNWFQNVLSKWVNLYRYNAVAKYDQVKSGVGKVAGIEYPSGQGGLRKKADYWDKDNVEKGARVKTFARYAGYYDRISALVLRKNKGLKPWGQEEEEAARREAAEEEKEKGKEGKTETATEEEKAHPPATEEEKAPASTEEKAPATTEEEKAPATTEEEKAPPAESGNSEPEQQQEEGAKGGGGGDAAVSEPSELGRGRRPGWRRRAAGRRR
jgi:hypothetical protein